VSLLSAPDPAWSGQAADEIARWMRGVPGLVDVHHVGSTSVPGLPAKPIIDLLPIFEDDAAREAAGEAVAALGYDWLGAHGLEGRSYARRRDPATGRRLFHAHGYAEGHADIARHLAFRDALRENAALRAGYISVKAACAARHPDGGAAYGDCKSGWIDQVEAKALERAT
jgi:GrpB-like predicted nucleotidyltransferase (UPF0157 family)